MARLSDEVNPQRDSSGSQFYITLAPTPFLDGAYTVFGQVIEGMDVVQAIRVGDEIKRVIITEE
jgi:cyclophilin family peptidyl-prolyl cis-trans isomerase